MSAKKPENEPEITSEMIAAGLAALDVFGDSPRQILVEEVLRAGLRATGRQKRASKK